MVVYNYNYNYSGSNVGTYMAPALPPPTATSGAVVAVVADGSGIVWW
jgi:hypothetical protein